ncbi:oleate hydratase [Streptomyces sp. NPDC001435]|uniref:oleate hydratase n=1 Tax=unclassified Streptomyces TaxID=2593676 RepID=UPI0036C62B32
MTTKTSDARAYLVGGGIASLAAAVFLIRDAGLRGENIRILEELPVVGGALDGTGDPGRGFVARGGRMLEEEAYVCLWDLLETIPTLTDPDKTVKDEVWEFSSEWPSHAGARLIDRDHKILDPAALGLNLRDKAELVRLLALPEHVIGARRIDEFFSDHFFATNFWAMWRTTFAFQNWHSAIELKRYMLRFAQELPRIHTLAGVRRTRLNQFDSIVRPIQQWLADRGVVTEHGTTVTDADFTGDAVSGRRITALRVVRDGRPGTYELGEHDYAFITLGSMTADAAYGADDRAPELIRDKRDGAFRLWEAVARKAPDFGRPNTFCGNVDANKWESFTLTMRSPLLIHRIQDFSGNVPGAGGLMTFKDSAWLMSLVVPHQPYFAAQPEGTYTAWGYGLFLDEKSDYVDKTMSEATGQEILTELVHQLGFEDALDEIRATTTVVPVMMPHITSQFAPRRVEDRPLVLPRGARNFAFLGQYTEIPEDVVFTVEYSVRGAMHGVYGLLGVDRPIPGIYHALSDPEVALSTLKAALA